MINKPFIIGLTAVITILSLFYLSFTFVARNINKEATQFAADEKGNIDFSKKQAYLDSIWNEPVYNLFGMEFTYKEVKKNELSLGLDLQGGMHVVLEVSPVDILNDLSANSKDPHFLQAIKKAREMQRNSREKFASLFYKAFKEIEPDGKLSRIFSNINTKGLIRYESSDEEVMKIIESRMQDATDEAYLILKKRIDQFGVNQPVIQKLKGTGRIQLELPGVENPARVRELLQKIAKLEFWEVWEPDEFAPYFNLLNDYLVKVEQREAENKFDEIDSPFDNILTADTVSDDISDPDTGREDEKSLIDQLTGTNEDLSKGKSDGEVSPLGGDLEGASPDTAEDERSLVEQLTGTDEDTSTSDTLTQQQSSLLASLFVPLDREGNIGSNLNDTARVNKLMNSLEVKAIFPPNMKFLWDVKPIIADDGNEFLALYPIKKGRRGEAQLAGDVIKNARQDFDERGRVAVNMSMNSFGAKKWRKLTRDNIGRRFAIVLDNYVYSAPVIQSEIPNGQSVISGNFTIEEAKDLSYVLNAGKLKTPVTIVQEAVVGPSLGKEAIQQGIVSIIAGICLVVLFMMLYYNSGGFVADIALLINVFFILGILSQPFFDASLTLPGIAGIVLTIGMSIDANVLIFERIREELRNGKAMINAIADGYNRAYSAIIDSNVTTFLTAFILYQFGSGIIRGFAVTLMIGILCSFFSAVFITRLIIEWMAKTKNEKLLFFSTFISARLFQNLDFNIISRRKLAYFLSGTLILVGIISIITQKGLNLGVDFKGGRSYVVRFDQPVTASKVKAALLDDFENAGTEVKTFDATNQLKITTSYLVEDESTETDKKVKAALISGLNQYSGNKFKILASSKVGATIADDIRNDAQKAVIYALIAIFLYILVRFRKWQFGLGALAALFHDVLIVISMISIVRLFGIEYEVDQVLIAAMLTVIGYSINDTVVVFDRVREFLKENPRADVEITLNRAINKTLSRTMMTSFTTLIVVFVLFLFGGEVMRGFSFALLVGIIVGTYSSIFIATPLVLDTTRKKLASVFEKKEKVGVR